MGYYVPEHIIHQCAWCAQMQDGEESGVLRLYIDDHGNLQHDAQPDVSHICCHLCYTRERVERLRQRADHTTLLTFE